MATVNPTKDLPELLPSAKRITGWYIAAAALLIVFGMFAIIEPFVAGLEVALLVGWLLFLGGVTHLIEAFTGGGGAKQVIFPMLVGMVYVIGGLYTLAHPLLAIGSLTLLLASVILAEGVLEIISDFQLKADDTPGWMFNGVITLLLGGLILFHWPSSSVWAIGILVGINLLTAGMTRLIFGLATLVSHAGIIDDQEMSADSRDATRYRNAPHQRV